MNVSARELASLFAKSLVAGSLVSSALLVRTASAQQAQSPLGKYGNGGGITAQQAPGEIANGDQVEAAPAERDSLGSKYLDNLSGDLDKQEREEYLKSRATGTDPHAADIDPQTLPAKSATSPATTIDGTRPSPLRPKTQPLQPKAGTLQPQNRNVAPPANNSSGITARGAQETRGGLNSQTSPLAQPELLPNKSPAAASSAAGSSATARADMTAIEALGTVFAEQPENPVTGEPLTLSAALARRSDREGRLQIAHGYWKLSTATAAYNMAVAEAGHTARLVQSSNASHNPLERQLITVAHAGALARTNEALTAVVAAQYDLVEAMGSAAEKLPLAADAPYLGLYATRFNELFADRPAPMQLRAINKTLPTLHLAVGQRAQASLAAVVVCQRAEEAWLAGSIDIGALLAALQHASLQRQAFLNVARAYNDDIADYAINVAREGTAATELTTMLIRTSTSQDARRNPQSQPRAASNLRSANPATYNEPVQEAAGKTTTSQPGAWRASSNDATMFNR